MGTSRFQRESLLQSVAGSAKSGLGPGLPGLRLRQSCLIRTREQGDTLTRQKVSMSEGNGRVHFPYSCSYVLVRLRQESLCPVTGSPWLASPVFVLIIRIWKA